MKALVLNGKQSLTLEECESPRAEAGEVILDVEATSIGGSEYLGFNNPGIRPLPNIMGHGVAATTSAGQRVAVYPLRGCGGCRYCKQEQTQLCDAWSLIGVQTDGGFAQKVAVPEKLILPLPDSISWEQSVFIEPFANSINAWEISNTSADDSIAIIGAGSLGLGLTACAKQQGCQKVEVIDLSNPRKSAALALGASKAARTLSDRYDVVFETVGSIETRNIAIQLTKKSGKCVFLGFETPMLELNLSQIIREQKQLLGSFVYSKSQFKKAITLAQNCNESWVTNIKFDRVETYLRSFLDNDFTVIKVALRPNW